MTKLTVALAVSGLLGLAGVAHAIVSEPTYTYEFEGIDGPDIFNNSTITIDGSGVTAFSFFDTDLGATPFTSGSEWMNYVVSYDTSGWTGDYEVAIEPVFTVLPAVSFEFPVFEATGDSMDEFNGGLDPYTYGTWTLVSAPDASSTFPLLLGVLAALAGVHYCNRPRVLALARR